MAPARKLLPMTAAYTPGSPTERAISRSAASALPPASCAAEPGSTAMYSGPGVLLLDQRAQVLGLVVGDRALGVRVHVDRVELERVGGVVEDVLSPSGSRRHQQQGRSR